MTLAAALATGLLAVSSQSLWIDEAGSAILAMDTDPLAFTKDRGSTLQMPLYMLMLWGWEKVFGNSEFALRAMNIPLFVVAMLVTATCWNASTMTRAFFLASACSSAFVWAYLDEARPYILQFLGATVSVVALRHLATSGRPPACSDLWLFSFGMIVLCGSSLIGVIFAFWFALAFLAIWLPCESAGRIAARKDFRMVGAIIVPLLLCLGLYYIWTLRVGAAASGVGKTSVVNLGFVAYELLGFTGAGPGRSSLRESLGLAVNSYAPFLGAYGLMLSAFAILGIQSLNWRRCRQGSAYSTWIFWLTAVFAAASVYLVGISGGFRLVGRHFTPLLPFILMLFALAASAMWLRREFLTRLSVIAILLSSMASSLAYRFSDQHAKDDYRAAAAVARAALSGGEVVWWAADPAGGRFYGLNAQDSNCSQSASNVQMLFNPTPSELNHLSERAWTVILAREDVYDAYGSIRNALSNAGYEQSLSLPGFRVYRSAN